MKIFLPYRGEFGFICMFHAPQVNAAAGPKTAIIEKGMEALYPYCEYLYIDRREEAERRARVEEDLLSRIRDKDWGGAELISPNQNAPRKYFVPRPYRKLSFVPDVDVVVCPRKRKYGPDKNWRHWDALVDELAAWGLRLFVAGHPESTQKLTDCIPSVFDFEEEYALDVTVACMSKAKLVLSTDCGLAHLALMCGRPLSMISHGDGLVADGKDDVGNPYWPIKIERFVKENHRKAPIRIINHAWHGTGKVIQHLERNWNVVFGS